MANFQEFDDCEICRAMKAAQQRGRNLSESELLAAFKRQEQTGFGMFGISKYLENI